MIFVAGIHGVGKTTFSNMLSEKMRIPHYSASKIIASADPAKIYPIKLVDTIDENQQLLIRGCYEISQREKDYILDGHMCLLDASGQITRIAKEVFFALNITKLIIIECSPEIIQKRLRERNGIFWSLEEINRFQEEEKSYGQYIAKELGIEIEFFCEQESI